MEGIHGGAKSFSFPCFVFPPPFHGATSLTTSSYPLGFPGGSDGKESAYSVGDLGLIPGWKDPLEKGTATHSSILAWRIPWTL